jgi:hypothetical protein
LNFDFNVFGTQNNQNQIILAQNFREKNADIKQIRFVFSNPNLLLLRSIIAKNFIILDQNLKESNTDFEHIRYVLLNRILMFLSCKITKTLIILAKKFYRKNYADFKF